MTCILKRDALLLQGADLLPPLASPRIGSGMHLLRKQAPAHLIADLLKRRQTRWLFLDRLQHFDAARTFLDGRV